MDAKRKYWNEQEQKLQCLLSPSAFKRMDGSSFKEAIDLFLSQHAILHSALVNVPQVLSENQPPEIQPTGRFFSFADEIWRDLPESAARLIPKGFEHSIALCFWHLARVEDVTMNILVAGEKQIFRQEGWQEKMNISIVDTGNGMDAAGIRDLSTHINLDSLLTYRNEVGRRTRQIVSFLQPQDLPRKVDPSRLQRILDEGAVLEAGRGVVDYWGKRTIAGLLLMPPTRHCFVHLNEAARIKDRTLRR